MKQTSTK